MENEAKALVYSVLTQVEYFMTLIQRKKGRAPKGINVSKLNGFKVSNFEVLLGDSPVLSMRAEGPSNLYKIDFSLEEVQIMIVGTSLEDTAPVGLFPYENIKSQDGENLVDLRKVHKIFSTFNVHG